MAFAEMLLMEREFMRQEVLWRKTSQSDPTHQDRLLTLS